ncbi:MAG: metallophosphoesterase [Spirochaetota bacterium]
MSGYIAIGDVHGYPDLLSDILQQAKQYPEKTLVFLGDYIDRGPDSQGVVELLQKHKGIYLLGNHEAFFLQTLEDIEDDTLRQVYLQNKRISGSSYIWLKENLQLFHETEDYIFSHAGLEPTKTRQEQTGADYYESSCEGDYYSITDKFVVHGHMTCKEVEIIGNNCFVDTGCSLGGRLSAIVLPERKVLQSREKSKNYYHELFRSQY